MVPQLPKFHAPVYRCGERMLELPPKSINDPEIVPLDQKGKPTFHSLLRYSAEAAGIMLYALDLLPQGEDVRPWLLEKRHSNLFERAECGSLWGNQPGNGVPE
jgi:hypothetical protein